MAGVTATLLLHLVNSLKVLPSDASRGPGQCFRLPPLLLQRNARAIGARGGALTKRINVDANGSIGDGGG